MYTSDIGKDAERKVSFLYYSLPQMFTASKEQSYLKGNVYICDIGTDAERKFVPGYYERV